MLMLFQKNILINEVAEKDEHENAIDEEPIHYKIQNKMCCNHGYKEGHQGLRAILAGYKNNPIDKLDATLLKGVYNRDPEKSESDEEGKEGSPGLNILKTLLKER